jgi:hypothetical protein
MTLDNLLGLSLETVEPDAVSIARLLEAAQGSLADAQLPNLSREGCFDMSYKAIMQAANAALQANGFRTLTSKPGHCLGWLVHGFAFTSLICSHDRRPARAGSARLAGRCGLCHLYGQNVTPDKMRE